MSFKGLRTVIYPAPDLKEAKEWYTAILGEPPYFDEAYYVGFDVGGYELGLIPKRTPSKDGAVVYWGVTDINETWEMLLKLGAIPDEEVIHVGGEVYVATVIDPFGNTFGIIQNPSFKARD